LKEENIQAADAMGKPLPIDAAHRIPKDLVTGVAAAGNGSYSIVVTAAREYVVALSSLEVGKLLNWP
jgi:hypothetical protein